ncbi:MAG: hypothetical protein PUC44_04750 [Eubacteriales bacterium]|nr:hypothetical protein [Eubacteriales bacterium]
MKNKRKEATLFLLILFLSLFLPGKLLTPKIMNDLDLSSGRNGVLPKVLSEPEDSIDLLIIGDSESYSSIDPRVLKKEYNIRTYAAGQAGATIGESCSMLGKILTRQKPAVILYETNSLFRAQPDPNNPGTVVTNTLEKIFPLLKYHSAWKSPFISKYRKTYMGFRIEKRIRPYKGGNYMAKGKSSKEDARINKNNIQSLKEIKALAEANGAKLIMYSAPSPRNYSYSRHMALTELAAREHIEYIDMNMHDNELKMNWKKDTRDRGDHLNIYGAKKATKFMGRYLSSTDYFSETKTYDLKTYDMKNRSVSEEKRKR